MTAFDLNVTRSVLIMTGFVQNKTQFFLDITGFAIHCMDFPFMTGVDLNILD